MDPDRRLNMFPAALTAGSRSNDEAGNAEAAARYQLHGNDELAAAVSSIRANYYAGNRPRHLYSYSPYAADQQGLNGNVDQARLFQDPMQLMDAYTQVGHAHNPSRNQQCHGTAFFPYGSSAGLDVFPPGTRIPNYSNDQTMGSSYAELTMYSSHSQTSPRPSPEGGVPHGSALESTKRPRKRKSNYSPTPENGERKEVTISLRKWLSLECSSIIENREKMVVRTTSVAYAIVELMRAARRSSHQSTAKDLCSALNADNFTVFIEGDSDCDDFGMIVGMKCSNPPSTLRMITPTFVPSSVFGSESNLVSEYLEVAVDPAPLVNDALKVDSTGDANERDLSRQLGSLLLYLYQHIVDPSVDRESSDAALGSAKSLLGLGYTSSVQLLVTELFEGKLTLDEASIDLHAMLLTPAIFLHDNQPVLAQPTLRLGKKKLYGREDEQSAITDQFCRVATSGTSEALLIGGFSGELLPCFSTPIHPLLIVLSRSNQDQERAGVFVNSNWVKCNSLTQLLLLAEYYCSLVWLIPSFRMYQSLEGVSMHNTALPSPLYISQSCRSMPVVISKKFCQSTNDSSLSLVIESFNDLVHLLIEESTKEELESVANDLLSSLGISFLVVLQNLLPAVALIFADASPETLADLQTQQRAPSQALISHSVQFLLERFVCAISSSERPGMSSFQL